MEAALGRDGSEGSTARVSPSGVTSAGRSFVSDAATAGEHNPLTNSCLGQSTGGKA